MQWMCKKQLIVGCCCDAAQRIFNTDLCALRPQQQENHLNRLCPAPNLIQTQMLEEQTYPFHQQHKLTEAKLLTAVLCIQKLTHHQDQLPRWETMFLSQCSPEKGLHYLSLLQMEGGRGEKTSVAFRWTGPLQRALGKVPPLPTFL